MTLGSDGYYVAVLNNVTGTGNFNYVFNDGTNGGNIGTNKTNDLKGIPYAPGKEVWFDYETVKATRLGKGATRTGLTP